MMPIPEGDHTWSVRVRWHDAAGARVYARTQSFEVGSQASIRESDPRPSALEYLLGALAGDLACGLQREASARSLAIHSLEVAMSGRLQNVLVHFGVIGEEGHPGLEAVTGTVYVGTDADAPALEDAWRAALARSPLFTTLSRCAPVSVALRMMP